MPAETTYTRARAELADLCDQVTSTREPVIIHRRGHEDVALVPADELRGLQETAHLLRSPTNAARLMKALRRAQQRQLRPRTVDALREELGLGEAS